MAKNKLNIKVKKFNILGIVTKFKSSIWVKDEYGEDGGYYLDVEQTYKQPMINIDLELEVNIELKVGGYYFDGKIQYMAISKNILKNVDAIVVTFTFPTEIVCIGSDFDKAKA